MIIHAGKQKAKIVVHPSRVTQNCCQQSGLLHFFFLILISFFSLPVRLQRNSSADTSPIQTTASFFLYISKCMYRPTERHFLCCARPPSLSLSAAYITHEWKLKKMRMLGAWKIQTASVLIGRFYGIDFNCRPNNGHSGYSVLSDGKFVFKAK